jgi:acyl carrier protein
VATSREVVEFLTEYFAQREGSDLTEVINNPDLVNSGYLDSLDMISLATEIESRFGLKIDLTSQDTFRGMRTWNGIIELIEK